MGIGYAYGKNILIGDQFVLNGVPAIVSALPFRTETKVERLPEGSDLIIEDHRTEVPGYIQKKAAAKKPHLPVCFQGLITTISCGPSEPADPAPAAPAPVSPAGRRLP